MKEGWYNRFQTFAMNRMASPSLMEEDSLLYWRVRILFSILFAASVLSLITFIPVIILVSKNNLWGLGLFDAASWIIVLTLMLARNIRFETRSAIASVLTYLVGLVIIIHVGFLSGGTICLFGFAVLIGIFKETKAVTGALAVNAITLIITGWLISSGRFGQTFQFFKTTEAMMAAWATFMVINTVVAISVRVLVKGLAIENQKQKLLVNNLESEHLSLENTKIMLELEVEKQKQAEKALKESEERYRDLVEKATDIIITHDLKGEFLSANAAAERASGFSFEKNAGICLIDLMPPDRRHEFDAYIEAIQREGSAAGIMQFLTRDGKVRFWEYRNTLRTEGVPVPVVRAIARDVTEKIMAKRALVKSEKRYRLLFERNLAGVYRTTMDGRLLDCNEAFARIYGYGSRKETLQYPVADFHVSPEALHEFFAALKTRGSLIGYERIGRRKDGSLIWLSENVSLVPGENSEQSEIEGTLVDITDRRRAEEALRESEEIFRQFMDNSPIYVFFKDENIRSVRLSKNYEKMLGRPISELIGKNMDDLFPSELAKSMIADDMRILKEGKQIVVEEELNGRLYTTIKFPIIHEGKPRYLAGYTIDITERKQAEKERMYLEDQYRQLQKAESLGRMAGAIAHHFNNQLAVVMGNLELAMGKMPHGEGSLINITEAMQSARKAAKMSGMMLTYLGQTPVKCGPLDLSETFRRSLTMLRDVIPKEVFLNIDLPSYGPIISADEAQVQQVITNLVTNAWEAMDEGRGTINLTVKMISMTEIKAAHSFPVDWKPQENDYACIEIADPGCGIAEKDIEKLFDPFFSSKFTGRGLGLAVVLGIMKSHGGAVTVESEPGRGSIFRVFFPLSKQLPLLFQQQEKANERPGLEKGAGILLVEDEAAVRKMAGSMLTFMGYIVYEAKDGVDAVEVFRRNKEEIRCVICDLTMPRLDGWGTLIALRKLEPDIPVILVSGFDREKVMAGDHPEWPQVFLNKPYELNELGTAIRRAVGGDGGLKGENRI